MIRRLFIGSDSRLHKRETLSKKVGSSVEAKESLAEWTIIELPGEDSKSIAAETAEVRMMNINRGSERILQGISDVLWERHGLIPEDIFAFRVPILREVDAGNLDDSPIINIIATENKLITSSRSIEVLDSLENRVSLLNGTLSVTVIIQVLLGYSLEEAADFTDSVTDKTASLEAKIYTSPDADWVNDIYTLRAQIANGRRQLLPLVNRLRQLNNQEPEQLNISDSKARSTLRRLFRGFTTELEDLDNSARLLADLLTAQFTLVQIQQNSDMRKISAYAALAAVPTLIAGIYGMNFDQMPELSWAFGYPVAIGIMLAAVLGLRQAFKRSGWL